jgi:ABC-type nickel/cobalt efflux system permease component RcnA
MLRALQSHCVSTLTSTAAFIALQSFDIKATKEPSATTSILLQIGIISLVLIGLLGFTFSWRQGRKQAEKHMRAAGLNPDRDEEPKGL